MGKTQSKRSVDITTEGKKTPDEDITGKLEKIDDIDQKQINGDTNPQENVDTEKKNGDEKENDKDLTTEKSVETAKNGSGDSNEGQNTTSIANEVESAAVQEANKTADENFPVADDSNKKSKKEKVKKKWSFRSISFGKKDKQKPAKTEETAVDNGSSNGEPAEVKNINETIEKEKNYETIDTETVTPPEKLENGDVSEKQLTGEMIPVSSLIDDNTKVVLSNEISTNNVTTETPSSDTTEINLNTATENNQTDKKIGATTTSVEAETEVVSTTVSNGAAPEKNGTETLSSINMNETVTENATELIEASVIVAEKIKSIPNVVNHGSDIGVETTELHQNGVSADGETTESKSQAEVTLQTEIDVLTNKLVTITTTISTPNTLFDNLDLNIETTYMENDSINEKTENPILEGNVCDDNLANAADLVSSDAHRDNLKEKYKDFNRTVSVAESAESQNPPPLPTSPPPSQMSVFAFNDGNKSEENCDAVATDVAETIVEILPTVQDDLIAKNSPVKNSTNDQIESNICEINIDISENCSKNLNQDNENTEMVIADFESSEDPKLIAYSVVSFVQENLEKKEQIEQFAEQSSRKSDEFKVASAVIDEITEKAVEIIRNQTTLEPSEQHNTICLPQGNYVKTDEDDNSAQKNGVINVASVSTGNSFQCNENDINSSDSHTSTEIKLNLPPELNNTKDDEWQVQNIKYEKELKKDCIILSEKDLKI